MTKKSTFIQKIAFAFFLMLASQVIRAQDCTNLNLSASQMPCIPNANDVLNPAVDFAFDFSGSCTVAELIINLGGTDYPFAVAAPDNVSGSVFSLTGFPSNVAFSAYYVLNDGTQSEIFDFNVGDCTQDAVICDCDDNQHTIGVLSWLGDTYADNAAYAWAGVTVNFNCATWGYDCGDIAGAPAEDPFDVCGGNLPPNNGCAITDVFGCTDPAANNYNPDATADDGSCMYDIAGCTDPTANNYDPMANIEDGSCTYGACANLNLNAVQMPCIQDANDVLNPSVDFVFDFSGACTVAELIINLDGTEYPFTVDAPENVSGSIFSLVGFPANVAFSAYYLLADGTPSDVFDFTLGDCTQDAVICDCDGNQHTIGVLSWLGDTYADNAAYTWAGTTVNFECATWGYDCGDIAGAPAEDPYDVCGGNLPPNNGCSTTDVFGCIDPTASNYNSLATIDDGSCIYDIYGCTDATANNYNPSATINDGSCTYDVYGCTNQAAVNYNPAATIDDGSCVFPVYGCTDPFASNYNPEANVNDGSCLYEGCVNLMMEAIQTPCLQDNAGALNPGVDFLFVYSGSCTVSSINVNLGGTDYPLDVAAPANVSGSVFSLSGFPANATFTAYYVLSDGTQSPVYDYTIGDCSQDPIICDCDGNQHTIGVLSWLGDTYADNAAYTWAGTTVNFECATWGYDCGDIVGAPAEDPYDVCGGNLPPNNGCAVVEIFGCTDPAANNYNPDATADDGSCMYDIAGCTDPTANNYDPMATIDDGSCTYGACANLNLNAVQMPCIQDANDVLNPSVDFVFDFSGACTVAELIINLDGTEYPFTVDAPENVSGSIFSLVGFPANVAFSAYYLLADGTPSDVFDFTVGDCTQDAVICDCDGNQHTIGVLSWLGDTYADNAAYTWAGTTVNFECATWGYDCGDIAGAPAEDPYGVCAGNLPPNNGCSTTSVEEVASVMFEAYPNPTSGMITLVNRGEGGNKQIRVFDQTGKLQLAEQRSMNAGASEQFNLSNLAAGTYHVQVVGNNGVSNITVIVQK